MPKSNERKAPRKILNQLFLFLLFSLLFVSLFFSTVLLFSIYKEFSLMQDNFLLERLDEVHALHGGSTELLGGKISKILLKEKNIIAIIKADEVDLYAYHDYVKNDEDLESLLIEKSRNGKGMQSFQFGSEIFIMKFYSDNYSFIAMSYNVKTKIIIPFFRITLFPMIIGIAGFLLILIYIRFLIKKHILSPLAFMQEKANEVGAGDLTIDFIPKTKNEFLILGKDFSSTISMLKTLIKKVYVTVIVLTNHVRTLYQTSNAVESSADSQVETVEETVRSVETLNKRVQLITNESSRARKFSEEALANATVGMESMTKLKEAMGRIEKPEEITEITTLINVAEQTGTFT